MKKAILAILAICALTLFVNTLTACGRVNVEIGTPESIDEGNSLSETNEGTEMGKENTLTEKQHQTVSELIARYEDHPQYPSWYEGKPNYSLTLDYGEPNGLPRRILAPIPERENGNILGCGVYITEALTAIAYGGVPKYGSDPLTVTISRDMGETWTASVIDDGGKNESYYGKYIGFTSDSDGWLVLNGEAGMGHVSNYVWRTADGGATWQEVSNTNGIENARLMDAGFCSADIGFLCFAYRTDTEPVLYRTADGGESWEKVAEITIPEEIPHDYAYPCCTPLVQNGVYFLPVYLARNDETPAYAILYYVSVDGGVTWQYYKEQ